MKKISCVLSLLLGVFSIIFGSSTPDNPDITELTIKVIITNTSADIYNGDIVTAFASDNSKDIRFRIEPAVKGIYINTANGQIATDQSQTNDTSFTVIAKAEGCDSEPFTFTVKQKMPPAGFTAKSLTMVSETPDSLLTDEKELTASREFNNDFRSRVNFNDWCILIKKMIN